MPFGSSAEWLRKRGGFRSDGKLPEPSILDSVRVPPDFWQQEQYAELIGK
jgi:hypothetical protein